MNRRRRAVPCAGSMTTIRQYMGELFMSPDAAREPRSNRDDRSEVPSRPGPLGRVWREVCRPFRSRKSKRGKSQSAKPQRDKIQAIQASASEQAQVRRPFNLDESRAGTWDARAEAAKRLWLFGIEEDRSAEIDLPEIWSIADLGCGDERLGRALIDTGIPHRYQGYDVLPQSPTCQRWNINEGLPTGRVDVAFALGLLEYLADVSLFFHGLRAFTRTAVISYVAADSGAYRDADVASRGWRNHYLSSEIMELLTSAGLRARASAVIDDRRTFLWLLEAERT